MATLGIGSGSSETAYAQNLNKHIAASQAGLTVSDDVETYFVINIDTSMPSSQAQDCDRFVKDELRTLRNLDYAGRLKVPAVAEEPDLGQLCVREKIRRGRVLHLSARYRVRIRRTIEKGDGTTGDYLIRKDRETHILITAVLFDAAERKTLYDRREESAPDDHMTILRSIRDELQALYPDPVIIPARERILRVGCGPVALLPYGKYETIISAAYGVECHAALEGLWEVPIFPLVRLGAVYGVSANSRIDHYGAVPFTLGIGGTITYNRLSLGASVGAGMLFHAVQAESLSGYVDPLCALAIDLSVNISSESALYLRPGINLFPEQRRIGCYTSITAGLMRKL